MARDRDQAREIEEYVQHILYTCMQISNETHAFVQFIYTNKNNKKLRFSLKVHFSDIAISPLNALLRILSKYRVLHLILFYHIWVVRR
jgi:hypothetical protein